MRPSKRLLVLLSASVLSLAAREVKVQPSGLVLVTGINATAVERTLFGISYSPAADPISLTPAAERLPVQRDRRGGVINVTPPAAKGTIAVPKVEEKTPARVLDYGIALKKVPIEMVLTNAVIIGGNRMEVGDTVRLALPLSTWTGAVKQQTSMRAGSIQSSRIVENQDESVMVVCRFTIRSINRNEIIFTVISDDNYPSRENTLTIKL